MVDTGTPALVVAKILNNVEQAFTGAHDRLVHDVETRAARDGCGLPVAAIDDPREESAKLSGRTAAHGTGTRNPPIENIRRRRAAVAVTYAVECQPFSLFHLIASDLPHQHDHI